MITPAPIDLERERGMAAYTEADLESHLGGGDTERPMIPCRRSDWYRDLRIVSFWKTKVSDCVSVELRR